MNYDFNKGDVVICLDANASGNQLYFGVEYQIAGKDLESGDNRYYLRNSSGNRLKDSFFGSRFKLKKEMKKVIGYKAPSDLFEGAVKKDTVYVLSPTKQYTYFPQAVTTAFTYNLPKEVVETWQPVYEEEEIKLNGYKAVVETIGSKKVVAFGCQKFDKDFLSTLYSLLSNGEAKAELKIGGVSITQAFIEKLWAMIQ